MENETKKCKICDLPAYGCHFGVLTCRACAAFFRRGALRKTPYKCKNPEFSGNCTKKSIFGGIECKKCRMEKCKMLGMNMKKIQLGRDTYKERREIVKISKNSEIFPEFPKNFEPRFLYSMEFLGNSSGNLYIDLKFMLKEAENIFRKCPNPPQSSSSSLLNLSSGLLEVRPLPTIQNFRKFPCVNRKMDKFRDWEDSFLRVATWLTHFQHFQPLPISLKMKFLEGIWHIWTLFDKLFMNCESRRRGLCDNDWIMTGYGEYVNFNDVHIDYQWCCNYQLNQMGIFQQLDWNMLSFINPLMILNPTNVELTFMLSYLCFNYAGKRLQGEILEICDKFQEILANDLHFYYKNEVKMEKYSIRLAQLMKFIRSFENDLYDKSWKVDVGVSLDIWKLNFSHPNVFKDNFI